MIFSYIALGAVLFFLARFAIKQFTNKNQTGTQESFTVWQSYIYNFLAGVLFANSIPHFIHGISGDYFPAPFFHELGKGAPTDIVNVLWGLFNFAIGYNLVSKFQNMLSPKLFRVLVFSGFACMSIFLSVVFSQATNR
jgi:hypothetical protein